MNRNEKVLADWKSIHDKGIGPYVVPYSLCFLAAIFAIAVVIFLIYRPDNANTISSVIANNSVVFVVVTLGRVHEWFKREKQYKNVIELFELADKCPMCSAKTYPEDKICSSCGVDIHVNP